MGWVDNSWKLTRGESLQIRRALSSGVRHRPPNKKQAERALRGVLLAMQNYRSFKVAETRWAMGRRKIKAQLREMSLCANDDVLRLMRLLDPEARELVELEYCELASDAELARVKGSFCLWRASPQVVREAARAVNLKSRMKKETLGVLVNELANIWECVHGTFPKRSYGNVICGLAGSEDETGPFLRFVRAVLDILESGLKCPHGLIRKVIDGRKLVERRLRV